MKDFIQPKYMKRYREIISVLFKYKFGFLFNNLIFRKFRRKRSVAASDQAPKFRQALEELGPTFIKLGQLLSVRADLLPAAYIQELERLQDEVPPFSTEEALAVCAQSGINTQEVFTFFSPEPIAAASIAQVHRATLVTGKEVAVKIQRPHMEAIIKTDLDILASLGRIMEKRLEWARFYQISAVISELRRAITLELDFMNEAKNIERFRKNFQKHPEVIIPDVLWEYTNNQVIVMEYVEGTKISDLPALNNKHIDKRKIADTLIAAMYWQIYEFGFFHADPHPGNLAIADDGRLIFYDFGQAGTIDNVLKEQAFSILLAMFNYDVSGVTRTLLEIGIKTKPINRLELTKDVSMLQKKYYGMPLADIKIGEALFEIIRLFNKYQVMIPAELSLLAKMAVTVEGIIFQLDPSISIVDIVEPYGKKAFAQRFSPTRLRSSISSTISSYMNLAANLPLMTEDFLHLLESGEIKIKREDVWLPAAVSKINSMITRLSLALLMSALIISLAVLGEDAGYMIIGGISMFKLILVILLLLTVCFIATFFRKKKQRF